MPRLPTIKESHGISHFFNKPMPHSTFLHILFCICVVYASHNSKIIAQSHNNSSNKTCCTKYDFFNDSTIINNNNAFDNTFASFINEIQAMPPAIAAETIQKSIQNLYNEKDERKKEMVRQRLEKCANKILADSTSAYHNILLYSMFTKILNLTFYADVAQRNGNEYIERNLKKNLPGTPSADFVFIDRNNNTHSLYKEKSPFTILFFYDPDCHVCHDIAKQLAAEPSLTSDPKIKVLAIYTDNETERWKAHQNDFPKSWLDGYSPNGEITEKEPYYLPVIPSIYLLDHDKHVLLRDVSPETLIEVIKQLTKN